MPLLYTPKLLKHYNEKVWTEWESEQKKGDTRPNGTQKWQHKQKQKQKHQQHCVYVY